jgi:uncharacterized protein (TIGR02246 family)
MSAPRLRHALRGDLEAVSSVWVEAFAHDPYLRWIQPDDSKWPAFGTAWMTFIADLVFERGHTYVDDAPDVALAWVPPDVALVGADDIARGRAIIAHHAGEARADDAVSTIMTARAHAIEEPHWTLQYIGVSDRRRGTGVGAAAVAPMLKTCDAEGLPCGLVSTNAANISFYERLGFSVDAEVATPDGAATMRPMHRPPRAANDPTDVMAAYADAWQTGDAERAWTFFADDVVMHLPGRGSLAGEHRGRTAVVAAIRALLARTTDSSAEVEVLDRLVSGNRVAMVLREAVVRGDERLDLQRVNVYRIEGGRIVDIRIYEADQYDVDEFFG